ncbi:MAG: hypothetical protein EP332_08650 [Bacteroidetes bacterium]|nr:MAG: hypothetical protein EP332_08650 [Bacteroidota bacterium]
MLLALCHFSEPFKPRIRTLYLFSFTPLYRKIPPMKRILLLALAVVLITATQAQSRKLTIYFNNDCYALTDESKSQLKAWLAQAPKGEYQIELEAHTDQTASAAYNQKLSQNRANSTRTYLLSEGIESARILSAYAGETKPVEAVADGTASALNRRVDLRYKTLVLNSTKDLIEWERRLNRQEFMLKAGGTQEIKGKEGTIISIPSNAFQLANGQYVDNSEVTMVLQEFNTFQSAILNGLTTQTTHHETLESGGMFKVEAKAYGQNLQLREGMELGVQMPSTNIQEGMTVFYGSTNAQGQVVWQNSQRSFEVKGNGNRIERICFPDSFMNRLNEISIQEVEKPNITVSEIHLNLPKRPNMPYPPIEPKLPVMPTRPEGTKPLLIVGGEWKDYEDSMMWYKVHLKGYERRIGYYERKLTRYHRLMKRFIQDSMVYGQAMQAYNDKIDAYSVERENAYTATADYANFMAQKNLKSTIEAYLDQGVPRWDSGSEVYVTGLTLEGVNRQNYLYEIALLSLIRNPNNNELYHSITKKGEVDWDLARKYMAEKSSGGGCSFNFSRENSIDELTKLNQIYQDAFQYVVDYRLKNGIVDRTTVPTVLYQTSLNQMGYINCDRFSQVPAYMMTEHDIYLDQDYSTLSVCVNRFNSLLSPQTIGKNHYRIRVPIGVKITLVAIGAKEGKAYYCKEKLKLSMISEPSRLKLKETALDELKKDLKKI